jgi:hypothetical protein
MIKPAVASQVADKLEADKLAVNRRALPAYCREAFLTDH